MEIAGITTGLQSLRDNCKEYGEYGSARGNRHVDALVSLTETDILALGKLAASISTRWEADGTLLATHYCTTSETWKAIRATVQGAAETVRKLNDYIRILANQKTRQRFLGLSKKSRARRAGIASFSSQTRSGCEALKVALDIVTICQQTDRRVPGQTVRAAMNAFNANMAKLESTVAALLPLPDVCAAGEPSNDSLSQAIQMQIRVAAAFADRMEGTYLCALGPPSFAAMTGATRVEAMAMAAKKGDVATMRSFLRAGTDPSTRDNVNSTPPLLLAAQNNHEDAVRLLLEHKADPNIADVNGLTPLACAAYEGYDAIVEMLLQAQAQINMVNKEGMTALCHAASMDNRECVRLLLEARADGSIANVHSRAPLHHAVEARAHGVVELLLNHASVNIDAVDNNGQTPLLVAASKGCYHSVEMLVQKGASCMASDRGGLTAIDHALRHSDDATVKFLLDALAADVDEDDNSRTVGTTSVQTHAQDEEPPASNKQALQREQVTVRKSGGHSDKVYATVFSPDSRLLASASTDGTIKIWTVSGWHLCCVIHTGKHPIGAIAFVPNCDQIAVAAPWHVMLFDTRTGEITQEYQRQGSAPRTFIFSPDCRLLAVAVYEHGQVWLWDFELDKCWRTHEKPDCCVCSLAFAPDGTRFASASDRRKAIRIWDTATADLCETLTGHGGHAHSVSFAPDGTSLISTSEDSSLRVWDTRDWRPVNHVRMNHVPSQAVFSIDGRSVAVISRDLDEPLRLWNDGEWTPLGGQISPSAVAFSPDGRYMASAAHDGTVFVRECANWRLVLGLLEQPGASAEKKRTSADQTRLPWPDREFTVTSRNRRERVTLTASDGLYWN